MKKVISKEVILCDNCNKEDLLTPCLKCGKVFCWECKKIMGIEYNHAVHSQGSDDGFYCHRCDSKLKQTKDDLVHRAYLNIKALRDEYKTWLVDFNKRSKLAEEHLKSMSTKPCDY